MSRETGHVKWFSNEKGYGFIERDGREDVFVHHSQISMDGYRTLDAGEPVEFDIMQGDRGPKAQDVLRLEQAAGASGGSSGRNGSASGNGASRGPSTGDGRTTEGEESETLVQQVWRKLGGRFFD